jgi:hypothetical protein
VVERTGRVGKHYIAQNTEQWSVMGVGAILAGVITSFTALFKYSLATVIQAPLLLAIAHFPELCRQFSADTGWRLPAGVQNARRNRSDSRGCHGRSCEGSHG